MQKHTRAGQSQLIFLEGRYRINPGGKPELVRVRTASSLSVETVDAKDQVGPKTCLNSSIMCSRKVVYNCLSPFGPPLNINGRIVLENIKKVKFETQCFVKKTGPQFLLGQLTLLTDIPVVGKNYGSTGPMMFATSSHLKTLDYMQV